MPKVDLDAIPRTNRTGYPQPYAADVVGRFNARVGDFLGLADFGISHVVLRPGAMSSQRHWHESEDELVVMLEGEAVLVEEGSREIMRPGDLAVFPKGIANGHQLVNESAFDCVFVAVGRKPGGLCHYPDIDLHIDESLAYVHKDGTPYAAGAS